MTTTRVLLFGFCKMAEYVYSPMVREMTGVRDVEIVYSMNDLGKVDSSKLVDVIAINAMAIGFNMNNQLQQIKLYFPEAFIICISPHRLSMFYCWKLIKNGIDALIANIDCGTEYKRAAAAIQVRRRYYPPELRQHFEDNSFAGDRGYRFLSTKEHDTLVLTLQGLTLKEIADSFSVAETTVCTTRKNALRKMGVRSLVELVEIGVQFNLNQTEENQNVMQIKGNSHIREGEHENACSLHQTQHNRKRHPERTARNDPFRISRETGGSRR